MPDGEFSLNHFSFTVKTSTEQFRSSNTSSDLRRFERAQG